MIALECALSLLIYLMILLLTKFYLITIFYFKLLKLVTKLFIFYHFANFFNFNFNCYVNFDLFFALICLFDLFFNPSS